MIGADAIIKALEHEGTDLVFGYPGGAIMPVFDRLLDAGFKTILVRHEQGASLAADGYARATGRVGVCIATSGPGATNLVTGIANAFLDSVPIVCITGQVATPMMGTDAFQEVDIFGMCLGVVKHSFVARDANDLYGMVRRAFEVARSGRPGPVLIDLPKDISIHNVETLTAWEPLQTRTRHVSESALYRAEQLIQEAQRPLIYVGGGVGIANAVRAFRSFVNTTRMPVVSTLKGLGSIETEHPLFLGMLGMHGMKAANYAVENCDLLIAIGARFDDRATGKLQEFAPGAKVIHMDIDPCEIGKNRAPEVSLCGALEPNLKALTIPLEKVEWLEQCLVWKDEYRWNYEAPGEGIYAPRFLQLLSRLVPRRTIVTADVGQHQMWLAQHFALQHPADHLTSGGLGTMGYGMPAAIGAQLGNPDALVICCSGDGSIMMNIQELATINRYSLPVKILLFDNQRLGMVRQWQELFFQERYSAVDLSDNPDFVALARSFGIDGMMIQDRMDEMPGIDYLINHPGPCLLHVRIDPLENVWPLVPPGKSNINMMEGTPYAVSR
ncbi:MAG TPA: acetolactate synthase 2 catalytic subunit [Oligoflexus sp.]|uniref:acetolactate synthase 2 catalytic subunit n=1 Tax=Oligoflexus sp. TaxID=1971216 RepID=UPI002D487291|nr:acetolactate synthase 2 catalytic subunit [Oligoflexus sp.]HYX31722.1 acetolactate synthase 2 catalytic subunit [Oligoflexus sp.]